MKPVSGSIALFSSGSGSNAEKIINYFQGHASINVRVLMSNSSKAFALDRAIRLGVPTRIFDKEEFYNSDTIINELLEAGVSWIVLAGFLWLIPENMIKAFPNRIINIHPALLPKYGGKGMYGMHVHRAVVAGAEEESGITIHLVNPVYDDGKIIFKVSCKLSPDDSPEEVAKKVQQLEHNHFPEVIESFISAELDCLNN